MGKHNNIAHHVLIILLLNLGTLLISLACPYCPNPIPPKAPPSPHLPPHVPPPPIVKTPPTKPKPPPNTPHIPLPPSPPKGTPCSPPPVPLKPPVIPKPPTLPKPPPPIVKPPTVPNHPPEKPCPPSPPPKAQGTCPIDTLKLGACVDALGGLINIGIGANTKDTCCPVLEGLVDLDAALCLCTTIKAKLLNINIIIPVALQVLVDCGKNPPSGFQCPA